MTGETFCYMPVQNDPTELPEGHCCVRRQRDGQGEYWALWIAIRDNSEMFRHVSVPIGFGAQKNDKRVTWELSKISAAPDGVRRVLPSIRVTTSIGGTEIEAWHQVIRVVGVPEPSPWEVEMAAPEAAQPAESASAVVESAPIELAKEEGPMMFSWDTIKRDDSGKVILLYRHERVFAEPFMSDVRDVLDVGGWGILATRLRDEGKDCIILDKFTTDQYYADRVRSLPHVEGDVNDPFAVHRKSFDLVTCFETLEHVDGAAVAVDNIFSWLRPGGHFVGTVPIPGHAHEAGDTNVAHFISESEMRWLLDGAGFVDVFAEPTVSVGGIEGEQPACIYFRAKKPDGKMVPGEAAPEVEEAAAMSLPADVAESTQPTSDSSNMDDSRSASESVESVQSTESTSPLSTDQIAEPAQREQK